MEKEKSFVDEFIDLLLDLESQGKNFDDLPQKELEKFSALRDKAYETIHPEMREFGLLIRVRKYKKTIEILTEKLSRIFHEK